MFALTWRMFASLMALRIEPLWHNKCGIYGSWGRPSFLTICQNPIPVILQGQKVYHICTAIKHAFLFLNVALQAYYVSKCEQIHQSCRVRKLNSHIPRHSVILTVYSYFNRVSRITLDNHVFGRVSTCTLQWNVGKY